ncbi:MAG: hypothetical protein COB60_00855 [Flavobacteriaceae bacterium]|nr:MAG: hypothetical protein COB60_00855 [Flavobacteriaceae bacterium]
MKELEQTKKISISAILFILIIIIGILSFKKPKITYANDIHTSLSQLATNTALISLSEYTSNIEKYVLLDIRDAVAYDQGHLKKAKHMSFHNLLNEENLAFFDRAKFENKIVAIYGETPMQANEVFLLLHQIGITNIQLLEVATYFEKSSLISKTVITEKLVIDIPAFIKKSNERKKIIKPKITVRKVIARKIIPKKKKKKYESEGGC